ncbi:hypothetical protein AK830_g9625 [Neonectria ditissima]|uniref:Uncharacterized protein n=1 Tax=Neonectria ditissima TaxID=78410 RepID=A0A0P7B9E1_9HYPO|nr:hypothetical protein AK830_g9625 [Neonectria ditissima]
MSDHDVIEDLIWFSDECDDTEDLTWFSDGAAPFPSLGDEETVLSTDGDSEAVTSVHETITSAHETVTSTHETTTSSHEMATGAMTDHNSSEPDSDWGDDSEYSAERSIYGDFDINPEDYYISDEEDWHMNLRRAQMFIRSLTLEQRREARARARQWVWNQWEANQVLAIEVDEREMELATWIDSLDD